MGGRLMENHRLLEADLEAEQSRGIRKTGRKALQGLLSVCNKSSVVREEKVPDQPLTGLGVSLEAPKVKEAVV